MTSEVNSTVIYQHGVPHSILRQLCEDPASDLQKSRHLLTLSDALFSFTNAVFSYVAVGELYSAHLLKSSCFGL